MARAVYSGMAWACWALRDTGCCGLLSRHFSYGWDEARDRARLDIANPLYRLWNWAVFTTVDAERVR